MLVCDFFRVDCAVTLQRVYVFFVLEVAYAKPFLVLSGVSSMGWTYLPARPTARRDRPCQGDQCYPGG
jgi:hypothetical protein